MLDYTIQCFLVTLLSSGTSLVVHGLRIRLPMQGTQVRSQGWEDPTCLKAAMPV